MSLPAFLAATTVAWLLVDKLGKRPSAPRVLLDEETEFVPGSTAAPAPELASSWEAPAATPAPIRIEAGRPYLFIIRLEVSEDAARPVLVSKGVENLVFTDALNPPFWAPETFDVASYGTLASFKATPKGNGVVTLGDPFYGVGRLESLSALDGHALSLAEEV